MSGTPSDAVTGGHVIVIDDDPGIRASLDSLFRSVGLSVAAFADPAAFLAAGLPNRPCCLVLDIKLGAADGLEFQAFLTEAGIRVPVVIMTGHGDIPMTVKGMKAGAFDFLAKPFADEAMLLAVSGALGVARRQRREDSEMAEAKRSYESLSGREREVMALVVSGLMNKQIAGRLDLSVITVKIHRANVMRKMAAQSLPDLVRLAETLGMRDRSVTRYHSSE